MFRLPYILLLSGLLSAPALAVPYWIAYEADDFPENEGWTRSFSAGGADRWIEDGALVIDSRASIDIFDAYQHFGITDPEPGELFVAEWRVRVDELIRAPGPAFIADNSLIIARAATPGNVQIEIAIEEIRIRREWERIPISAAEWHEYRIESTDMDSYQLYIDGSLAFLGVFESETLLEGFVAFGDTIIGAASLSRWDYVRFGVVPEPGAVGSLALGAALLLRRGS